MGLSCHIALETAQPELADHEKPDDQRSATTIPPGNEAMTHCTGKTDSSPHNSTSHSAARPTKKTPPLSDLAAVPRIPTRTGGAGPSPINNPATPGLEQARAHLNSSNKARRKFSLLSAAAPPASALSAITACRRACDSTAFLAESPPSSARTTAFAVLRSISVRLIIAVHGGTY